MALFVELTTGEICRLAEVAREVGDEALRIIEVRHPDGTSAVAADCFDWQECDCEEYLESGDLGDCRHLVALRLARLFKAYPSWPSRIAAKGVPR